MFQQVARRNVMRCDRPGVLRRVGVPCVLRRAGVPTKRMGVPCVLRRVGVPCVLMRARRAGPNFLRVLGRQRGGVLFEKTVELHNVSLHASYRCELNILLLQG